MAQKLSGLHVPLTLSILLTIGFVTVCTSMHRVILHSKNLKQLVYKVYVYAASDALSDM